MFVYLHCTNAVLLHQRYEVGFSEQLRRTRLSVRHLDGGGLELGALLIYWNHLVHTKRAKYLSNGKVAETEFFSVQLI